MSIKKHNIDPDNEKNDDDDDKGKNQNDDAEKCSLCTDESETKDKTNWLQCNACKEWYHTDCLSLSTSDVEKMLSYHCFKCVPKSGPTLYKRLSSRKKLKIDYVAFNQGEQSFVNQLHPHISKLLDFNATEDHPQINHRPYYTIDGEELTYEFSMKTALDKPVVVLQKDKTRIQNLSIPDNLSIDDICNYMGEDHPVEVMDCLTQESLKNWNLGLWKDYYQKFDENTDKIRNVISLEISHNLKLNEIIKRPEFVTDLDIIDKTWPTNNNLDDLDNSKNDSNELTDLSEFNVKRPKVSKYCLMSLKNSYTDFHIDFGGTSVFYNIVKGKKIFLMFPPTDENYRLYKEWSLKDDQNNIFFPDYIEEKKRIYHNHNHNHNHNLNYSNPGSGFKVILNEGDFMIIPSGWIHAVYTPEKSFIIGGNFLTLFNLDQEIKVEEIENLTKVPKKFQFPNFKMTLWLISYYYLDNINKILKLDEREKKMLFTLYDYLKNELQFIKNKSIPNRIKKISKENIPRKQSVRKTDPT
ncbi:[Histone H3]-lysine-36 demethylase [Ascoidea rubescens DSM 1968]|uniref:JmjC domain-containing histone demethylation protein 1 n=1 Tax=Ascoidea rubescens DSM 1968 TaxID=1344418 RepID=A0A1D2VAZ9_9ASCO|nr:Clavaminate synthase-like protein [Ascoidea rubescens DSM 1968]ODV58770.1 Clavaminate synthase-like protein [Ascoidea rubescens DSM 1968]